MADKELARVRPSFAEKVSIAVIKQLLDDLLANEVINEGEKESVLEENNTRTDKARSLIDTVRMKGDKASRIMIAHLLRRDKTLHSLLGLTCDQLAQPESKPQQEQQWSTKLLPSTDDFWKKKQNDKSVYPVTKEAIRSRVALLITNIKFKDPRANRHGAEKDEENMKKQLEDLGYEVVKHTNLTGKAIENAVTEFSKHPKLKGTDSVVVVIMSHGKLGVILGVDHTEEAPDKFPINNIYTHLGSEKCPALLDKPKIIIIQACRGEEKGSVLVCDDGPSLACDDINSQSASKADIEDDTLRYVHKEKDFISLLSSTPDTVSYRQREEGSFLIQYLVEVLNTFARTDHIEELFRMVMERFEKFAVAFRRQMPSKDRCSLTKHFYFFPGH